jgi:hypothetical protein
MFLCSAFSNVILKFPNNATFCFVRFISFADHCLSAFFLWQLGLLDHKLCEIRALSGQLVMLACQVQTTVLVARFSGTRFFVFGFDGM